MTRYMWCQVITLLLMINSMHASGNKLFYFLIDGFRWDYLDSPNLKGFPRMLEEGVRAAHMIPEFPTNSFPNYKTLETGLHVERHGFIGNYMYDASQAKEFDFEREESNREKQWWVGAESFYVTANKQGIRSALYFIFGCNLPYDGGPLSFCKPYIRKPDKSDIDWAIKDGIRRLANNATDVVYLMHVDVDSKGHLYGPMSPEVKNAIVEADQHVNDILDQLTDNKLTNDVDFVIVSDHGMSPLDTDKIINMTSSLNLDDIDFITETGAMAYIWPVKGKQYEVYETIKKMSSHLNVFMREDYFERWFFKNHRLTPPILVYANPGWTLVHPGTKDRGFEATGYPWKGNHGFDNNLDDMRSIFVAKGPHFKQGYTSQPISAVDVYQLLCHVTGILPRPHDGSWKRVQDMLRGHGQHTDL